MAQANVKAVITADDRASKTIAGVGGSFTKMAGAMGVGTLAAQGVTKAFDMMATAAVSVVKSSASFEQTRIGLENMLGSADKARKLLGDVSDFAAETPFEFPELAQATKQLVAFGFTGKEAFGTMKQLGDVSSAIGAPINDLAYLMGTLKTQGRAFMIDIRQFAQRGVPIYEALAAVFKTNTKEVAKLIEEGKVGFPQVQKAFKLMTKEGGLFHGAMAKQSKSLNGLWSTFKDVLGQTGRQLFGITKVGDIIEGSLFDKMRKGVALMIEKLPVFIDSLKQVGSNIMDVAMRVGAYLGPKLAVLWDSFQRLIPTIKLLWETHLKPLASFLANTLVAAIGFSIDWFNAFLNVLKPVLDWINKNKEAVKLMAGAIVGFIAASKIQAAVTQFQEGLGLMRTALSNLRTKLTTFNGFALFAAGAVAAFILVKGEMDKLAARVKARMDEIMGKSDKAVDKMKQLNKDWKAGKINDKEYQEGLKKIVSTTGAARVDAQSELKKLENTWQGQLSRAAKFLSDPLNLLGKRKGITNFDNNASGTDFFGGGQTMVGEQGPEVVTLPRGSKVTPNNSLKGTGGGTTINISVPMMAGSPSERRKVARMLIKDIQDIAAMNGKSAVQMMDSKYGLVT